jgi:hypothetical protein
MKLRLLLTCFVYLSFSRLMAFQDPSALSNQQLFQYIDPLLEELGDEALQEIEFQDIMAFVRQLGQIDRYQLKATDFLEHLTMAHAVRKQFSYEGGLSQKEFESYLLPLRIRYESTARSSWRRFFYDTFLPEVEGKTIQEASKTIFTILNNRIECDSEKTYVLPYRGDLDPLTTWRGGFGDEIDVSILATAILRSVGIPSRLVYTPNIRNSQGGKVWVEVMNERKEWTPWVPTFANTLAPEDHKAALQVLMKGKGGVIFANPADPKEVTGSYLQTTAFHFTPPEGTAEKIEYSLAFQVNSVLKPIRGYELISISTEEANRTLAAESYWSFTVLDDLSVFGEKQIKRTERK